ncbi:MAG: NAD(P)/FAD-dependent oxidoreductase [Nitrososphaerales archaeon]
MTTTLVVIIVGGGFGGIQVAVDLARKSTTNAKIILISKKPYFEYQPCLYRIATASPPFSVVVPLNELLSKTSVEVIEDLVIDVDLDRKVVRGSSGKSYQFNLLVLALGSEVNYHGVSILKDLTFTLKSAVDALRLNTHLEGEFQSVGDAKDTEKVSRSHIVVVGGGTTGAELSGELAIHARQLATKYGFDPSFITIDIIDSGTRLVKHLTHQISEKVESRLRSLGVNVFLNRRIVKEHIEEIYLTDMHLKTNTVIWAAGVSPNHFFSKIEGLTFDHDGRVLVDEFLQAKNHTDIFVIGDGATDPYSGLAQTAIRQGHYVANFIAKRVENKKEATPYKPRKASIAIPVGVGWAAVLFGPFRFYGRIGWLLRRLGDYRFFLSVLPLRKALLIMRSKKKLDSIDGLAAYLDSNLSIIKHGEVSVQKKEPTSPLTGSEKTR